MHEAGHAIAAHVLGVPLRLAGIGAGGGAHGRVLTVQRSRLPSLHQMRDELCVGLAGPAAERVVFGGA